MHIVETKDEKVDWNIYYTKGVPKHLNEDEWRDEMGHRGWDIVTGAVNHFPCNTCRESGQKLISGIRDMINIATEKGVFDPANFKWFVKEVNAMMAKWHEGGHMKYKESNHIKESAHAYAEHIQELKDAMPDNEFVLTPRAEHIMESA